MFQTITPEKAGISSRKVTKFVQTLNRRGLCTHSILMMKGNDVFAEAYWKPFHKDFCHRMYSQTKSFVGVAIGLLEEDGLLSLDDPIIKFFPDKLPEHLHPYLEKQTVRHMLTMETVGKPPSWFSHSEPDRTRLYFAENEAEVPPGFRWKYDSPGSQVLCTLVERLSGKSLFDFLNERIFRHLGTFKTATILKTKTEDSFGDSAMLCTTHDVASFARFVMNLGTWEGKRLMNEAYLRNATSHLVSNDLNGFSQSQRLGYGYQIWSLGEDGFFFNGMGGQLTYCLSKKDLIFAITSDNQGYDSAKELIYTAFCELIADEISSEPLPEDPEAYAEWQECADSLELYFLKGHKEREFMKEINGKEYRCAPNRMGITRFSLHFSSSDEGEFRYTNDQGDKVLPFGMGKNVFAKFPQYGYSNLHAGLPTTDGFMYDCAASAAWREEKKMELNVQIIDRYFGKMFATFSFDGDTAVVTMFKKAEAFLKEYEGIFTAKRK